MIQKIGNSVKGHRCFPASRRSLNHQNAITGVSDDGILFFLDGTDNIFQLYIAIAAKLRFQDFIIDFYITLKSINHLTLTDLILPFSCNFTLHPAAGSLVKGIPLVKIIKQTADRCPPVINQRDTSGIFRKITDTDIKSLGFFFILITEIHTGKIGGIQHFQQSSPHLHLRLVGIDLCQESLLIIEILITVLIHLRVIFPVILMHAFNFFFTFENRTVNSANPVLQFFQNKFQIIFLLHSTSPVCHTFYLSVLD